MYRDILNEQAVENIMLEELDVAIELAVLERDEVLLGSLHRVRAYYSIPGAYLEGAYDGE